MRLFTALWAVMLVAACTKPSAPAPDPMRAFQLDCRKEGRPLIFILDPKSRTVTVANVPMQPTGTFTASSYEYYLRFAATNQMHASVARVNRYDGRMEREIGRPPFLTGDIVPKDGNTLQVWQCQRSEARPAL